MKIVNIASQALPYRPSTDPIPPREPGKFTAAFTNPHESQSEKRGTASQREVKPRQNFAGGFQFPKRADPPAKHSAPRFDELNGTVHSERDDLLEGTGNFSGNIIESLETQVARLRKVSETMRQRQPSPSRVESLLHMDQPEVYRHHHHSYEEAPPQTMSLERLEQLKAEHERKLTEIEAEYMRSKQEGLGTAQWSSDDLVFHGKAISAFAYAGNTSDKPKVPTVARLKYEAKFENYLKKKDTTKGHEMLQGAAVTTTTVKAKPELEPFLIYIFKKIDRDGTGMIDKVELMQELHQNPELARIFGFEAVAMDPDYLLKFEELFRSLGSGNDVTFQQFRDFFSSTESTPLPRSPSASRPIQKHDSPPRPRESPSRQKESSYHELPRVSSVGKSTSLSQLEGKRPLPDSTICMLTEKQKALLEDLFVSLDVHNDMTVKLKYYLELLRNNERVGKILHTDAVRLTSQQVLNLETMLDYIETDAEDEYITWKQFLAYFHTRPLLVPAEAGTFLTEDPRLNEVDLPDKYMDMVARLFQDLPKPSIDKVSTFAFVEAMKKDPQVKGILSMTAREPSGLSVIPMESVGEVLRRMEDEAPSLVSWNDILGFFSKRGRPEGPDGYMSDPEPPPKPLLTLQNPKPKPKDFACQTDEPQKSAPSPEKGLSRSFSVDRTKKPKFNVTVPQPFSFDERELMKPKTISQRRYEEMVAAKKIAEENLKKYRYKAKPVPSAVTIPKYESLMAAQEARRLEVKRTSIAQTKATEKPFSFYVRDKERQKPEPPKREEYQFKANPIPWAVSVPLFDKMNREQKAKREELVAKQAQESLRKAHLPPRMEMHEKTKVAKEPELVVVKPYRAKNVPNFGRLQQAFQKTLDAKKHTTLPTEPKPFHFHETKSSVKRDYLNEGQEAQDHWGMKPAGPPLTWSKPGVEPRETQKLKDMIQLKKKQLLDREEAKHKLEAEEKERLDRREAMKPRVQNSQSIQSKDAQFRKEREDRLAAAKRRARDDERQYQLKIAEMQEKVKAKPLLVESVGDKTSAHTAKMKALVQFRDHLKQQGLDPKHFTINCLKAEFPAETEHLAHLAAVLDDLRKSSKHVRSFVIELIQHHESYGKALAKSARSSLQVLAKITGSLHLLHALRHLADHYETVGTLYSQQCSDLASWTTVDPADEVGVLRKKIVEDLQTAIKDTSVAKNNCVKAKNKYERMCREATSSQDCHDKLKTTPGSLYQVSALQRSEDKAKVALEQRQTAEVALKDCLETAKYKQAALSMVMKSSSEAVQNCERKFLEHIIQLLGAFLQINESVVKNRAEAVNSDQAERLSAIAMDLIEASDKPKVKGSLTLADILAGKVEGRMAAMEERKTGFRALKALLGELIIAEETAGRGLSKVSVTFSSLPVYLSNKQSMKGAWQSTMQAIEMLSSLHFNRCKTLSQHCLAGVSVTLTTLSQIQKDSSSQCSKAVKDHLLLEDECLKGFDRLKRSTDDVVLQQASQNLSEKMQRSAESTEKLVQGVLAEAANQEGRVLQGAKKVLVTLSSLEAESGSEVLRKAVTLISETQVWNDVEEQRIPAQGDVMALEQIKEEVSMKFVPKNSDTEEADALSTPRITEKDGSPLSKFNLPPESLIVESFSCALVRKIMLQGRLYLTTTHMCFHSYFNASTIFGKDTIFVVPMTEILRVEKRTYAFLFDNAIAVVTKEFELLFASFLARDQALSTLTGLMQLHPEAAHSPDDIALDIPPQAKLAIAKKLRGARPGRVTKEQAMEKLPPQSFYKYHVITRLAFSSPLVDVFQALFESRETWAKYYASRHDSEVIMSEWSPSLSTAYGGSASECPASSRRDHEFTHPVKVKAPLIPATCTCRELYEVFFFSETQLLIEVDVHVNSVPFADYFSTRTRWILEYNEGFTYIDLYYGMQFHKETWFQSRIEKSGVDEFTENINTHWLPLAKQIMQTRSSTGQQSTERHYEPQVIREIRIETQLHWVVWVCLALVLCLTIQLWRLQARVAELEVRR